MLRREQTVCTLGVAALAVVAAATLAGCGTGEKARREAEMAALVKQVDELKKGQDQMTREVGRLAGELKALDAQAAFLVGETKASAQEREQLKAALPVAGRGAARAALRARRDEPEGGDAQRAAARAGGAEAGRPAVTKEATPGEALRHRDDELPRRGARAGGARVHRADRQVPEAHAGRDLPVLDRRGLLPAARLQPGADRVPEGARSLSAEPVGARRRCSRSGCATARCTTCRARARRGSRWCGPTRSPTPPRRRARCSPRSERPVARRGERPAARFVDPPRSSGILKRTALICHLKA